MQRMMRLTRMTRRTREGTCQSLSGAREVIDCSEQRDWNEAAGEVRVKECWLGESVGMSFLPV